MATISCTCPDTAYSSGGTEDAETASSGSSVGQKNGVSLSITCSLSSTGTIGLTNRGTATLSYSTDSGSTWTTILSDTNGAHDYSGTKVVNVGTAVISQVKIQADAKSGTTDGEATVQVSAWSITYSDARRRVYVC